MTYNAFLPSRQGEIDVIGVAGHGTAIQVWLIEVAIHLDGLNYGGYEQTVMKITSKVVAAREYADDIYRDAKPTVEFWSPNVPSGLVARLRGIDVDLVANDDFTSRINELAASASKTTKLSGEDGFRMLQILTHLRGDRPTFGTTMANHRV